EHHTGDENRSGDRGGAATVGGDDDGCGDEGSAAAEIAGDFTVDDQQEEDGANPRHHDGQVGVQAHEEGEDEGGPEHSDDVLDAEAEGGESRGQPVPGSGCWGGEGTSVSPWGF